MGMTKRIVTVVKVRLEINQGHKEAVRRTVGFLALPFNAPLSAKCLWRTSDAMWNAAGDTATDYNHYTKRLILGGVYSTTLITWLGDESEGYQDTFDFLDRRIANIMEFEKIKARAARLPRIYRIRLKSWVKCVTPTAINFNLLEFRRCCRPGSCARLLF